MSCSDWKVRGLTALSLLVLGSAWTFVSARGPGSQKPPAKVVSGAPAGAPFLVSPGYIRMKHPEVIVNLATSVQSGKLPIAALSDLVGEDFAKSLVASNLSTLQGKIKAGSQPGIPAPVDYASVVTSSGPVPTLPPSAYSPHKIDKDDVRVGQTVTSVLTFSNLFAGQVTAHFQDGFGGAATVTQIADYTGVMAPTPTGGEQPVVSSFANGGGPITATAGQECCAFVKFKFGKAGTYKTNLVVSGTGSTAWSVSVPVEFVVTAMGNTTVTAYSDDGHFYVDNIGDTYDLPITLETSKFKSPFKVTITPKHTPSGISADPVTVTVNNSANAHAVIKVKGSPSALVGVGLDMEFSVDAGGTDKSTFKTVVNTIEGMVEIDYPNQSSGGSTWSNASLIMWANGSFAIGGSFSQNGLSAFADPMFFGFCYSTSLSAGTGYVNTAYLNIPTPFGGPNGGQSNWIKANWAKCRAGGPSAIFYEDDGQPLLYTGPQSQSSILTGMTITFPTNPPLTVTMW